MSDIFNQIINVDVFTISVVCVLSAWASIIIKHMTESLTLSLLFMPLIIFGALVGIFGFRELEIVFAPQKDSNIAMSAAAGMIFGLLIMLLATRFVFWISGKSKTGLEHRMTDA